MGDSVRICSRDDVAPGSARRFDVDGHRIALVRIGDDFYAIGDECSHADYSLSEGDVWEEECEIECPKHGKIANSLLAKHVQKPATRADHLPFYGSRHHVSAESSIPKWVRSR